MKRAQQGSFHVYGRGNKRNIVFYSSEDVIDFLRICNKTAEKYNTVLEEFVVMTNHFHLHLITDSLTEFMRRFLHNYVVRYNQRHKEKGKLF